MNCHAKFHISRSFWSEDFLISESLSVYPIYFPFLRLKMDLKVANISIENHRSKNVKEYVNGRENLETGRKVEIKTSGKKCVFNKFSFSLLYS